MENPRTKAKPAWKQRKEKEEETAATGPGHPAPARTSGPSPDIRPDPRKSSAHHRTHPKLNPVSLDIRPEARTSGSSRAAGHPAPSPDIRTPPVQRATAGHPGQPGHPASQHGHPARREAPNIRPPARTSGACLRTVNGPRAHVSLSLTPSWPSPIYTPPPPPS